MNPFLIKFESPNVFNALYSAVGLQKKCKFESLTIKLVRISVESFLFAKKVKTSYVILREDFDSK